MNDNDKFMDVDGPEFIQQVNSEIASIRSSSSYRQSASNNRATYSSANTPDPSKYNEIAIVDTNFLLSNLGTLNALLDVSEDRPGNLLVIVPWQVILELDGLKSRNMEGESKVGMSARKAMKFLEVHLRNKKYAIRGQRYDELFDKKSKSGGDDAILDCCLFFQQLTAKRLTLLSNDRNLCIKVMIHGVDSLSAESKTGLESLLNRVYEGSHRVDQQAYQQQHQQMGYNNGHILADQINQVTTEEDVDMDIDGDELYYDETMQEVRGSEMSRWAAAAADDQLLIAPTKNRVIMKDYSSMRPRNYSNKSSWSSIHAPK